MKKITIDDIILYPMAVVVAALLLVVLTLCIVTLLGLLLIYAMPLMIFRPRTCISSLDKVSAGLLAMLKGFKHEIDTDSEDN